MTSKVTAKTFSIVISLSFLSLTFSLNAGIYGSKYSQISISGTPNLPDVVYGDKTVHNRDMDSSKCTLTRFELSNIFFSCVTEETITISCVYVDDADKKDPLLVCDAGQSIMESMDITGWAKEDVAVFGGPYKGISYQAAVEGGGEKLWALLAVERNGTSVGNSVGSKGYFNIDFPVLEFGGRRRDRRVLVR